MSIEEKQTKAARNQALFRDVNEAIRSVSEDGVPAGEPVAFLCECADTACTETIELTLVEYESARRIPTRFPTVIGHEWLDVERVVERNGRYQVVEKFGEAGRVAVETAPHPG